MNSQFEEALDEVLQAAKLAAVCGEQQLVEKKRAFLNLIDEAVKRNVENPLAGLEAGLAAPSGALQLDDACLELSQEFFFECAHTLERQVDAEPSRRIHGHTYHAKVTINGRTNGAAGMVLDLAYLRAIIGDVREKLDHRLLDEVDGLGAGTIENLSKFIAKEVLPALGQSLVAVKVWRDASGDSCVLRVARA